MSEIHNQILMDEKSLGKRVDRFEMPTVLGNTLKFDKIRQNLYMKGKASVPHFGVQAPEVSSRDEIALQLEAPIIEKRLKQF
jgi:hypothetical protein